MRDTILIYDPNLVNPYGDELARVIASGGRRVCLMKARKGDRRYSESGVECRIIAMPEREHERFWAVTLIRLTSLIRVGCRSVSHSQVVVAWLRGFPDACLFLAIAFLKGGNLFVVHHNPTPSRARQGPTGWVERQILQRSVVCVHNEDLASHVHSAHDVQITPHPSYLFAARAAVRNPVDDSVLFVGALRLDKGSEVLTSALVASGGGFELVVVGRGELHARDLRLLREHSIEVRWLGGDRYASDDELLRELSRATVLIAPYVDVTESGSLRLAQAVGVPALGLDGGGVSRLLNASSRFGSPSELGAGLQRFLGDPWGTYMESPESSDEAARKSWKKLLGPRPVGRRLGS